MADYVANHPQSQFTSPQTLNNGVNARRARIGVLGQFLGDWHYGLVYDFGGTTDSLNANNAKPINSGIQLALLSYTGLNPLAIEGGYGTVPWTLDEATNSNDTLFLERASAVNIATGIAAGDFRAYGGARAFDDRYWLGAYATGPRSGDNRLNGEQLGVVLRGTHQVLQTSEYSLHLGLDGEHLFSPNRNAAAAAGAQTPFALSDQPELRVDPTTFLNTGTINTRDIDVYGGELAAAYQNFFFQSEYYHYSVNQQNFSFPSPRLNFYGWYAEASWALTGEQRRYDPERSGYFAIQPANPLSLNGSGWGALELAVRYSYVDLNSHAVPGQVTQGVGGTGGVFGGTQRIYTLGLNWYPNNNIRFMLDFMHGDIDKLNGIAGSVPLGTPIGTRFEAIALRTQVAF